jgi:ABC-type bacteriocin/lantibiotic exporter with double-glycine peptidase domain
MDTRTRRDKEARRVAALCGPKCLAELLRRRTQIVTVETLAREMKTDEEGTRLLALRDSARKRGFAGAEGVRLTQAGLKAQKLPLIALIVPGHFVLVDQVSEKDVMFWDPALGKSRSVSWEKWTQQSMGGVALTLSSAAVKTASR